MFFRYWEYFVIIQCVVAMVAVQSMPDQLPPPQKLSYVWTDAFRVNISWQEPEDLGSCQSEALLYILNITVGAKREVVRWRDRFYDDCTITTEEMGSTGACYTIETLCGKKRSRRLTQNIYPPAHNTELVKDFECHLYSTHRMNCSWIPASQVPDLQVNYRVCVPQHDATLSACEHSGTERRSCDLRVDGIDEEICVLFSGTLAGTSVRNTFKLKPNEKVKPTPPKLSIQEHGKILVFNWTTPNIMRDRARCWKYFVNYTICDVPLLEPLPVCENTVNVMHNKNCQYKVQVKSEIQDFCGKGGSDISDVETHGVNKDPDSSMMIAVLVIPAILSVCVILACNCFRRHRVKICPVVPDPSVIFKEMMMGSSYEPKSALRDLYIPAEEDVEPCKVSLKREDGV